MRLKLTTPLPPSVNHYMKYKVCSAGRKKWVQAYPSDETIEYKRVVFEYIKSEIALQGWKMTQKNQLIVIKCVFYMDRKHKDSHNLLKVPLDVFTEAGVWCDDDIAMPKIERIYIDSKNPRIEFEIIPSWTYGIFDTEEQYEEFFKRNCEICRRNVDKCSVLRQAKENRLVDDIRSNKECLKIKRPIEKKERGKKS